MQGGVDPVIDDPSPGGFQSSLEITLLLHQLVQFTALGIRHCFVRGLEFDPKFLEHAECGRRGASNRHARIEGVFLGE